MADTQDPLLSFGDQLINPRKGFIFLIVQIQHDIAGVSRLRELERAEDLGGDGRLLHDWNCRPAIPRPLSHPGKENEGYFPAAQCLANGLGVFTTDANIEYTCRDRRVLGEPQRPRYGRRENYACALPFANLLYIERNKWLILKDEDPLAFQCSRLHEG